MIPYLRFEIFDLLFQIYRPPIISRINELQVFKITRYLTNFNHLKTNFNRFKEISTTLNQFQPP